VAFNGSLMRTNAMAPEPAGVANAQMVSLVLAFD